MELQESKLARLPGRVWGALTPGEGEDPPPRSVQDRLEAILQADRLEKIILTVAGRHIPRGARADPRPWALDPELEEAVRERRSARSALRPDDPASRDRWIAAKKAAARSSSGSRGTASERL